MAQDFTNQFDEYGQRLAQATRARTYAQALLDQGLTPMGNTEVVSGIAARRSPFEAAAKLLKARMGRLGLEQAAADERQIGADYRAASDEALRRYQQTRDGVAGAPEVNVADDQLAYGGSPTDSTVTTTPTWAKAPDARAAMVEALNSPFERVRDLGKLDYATDRSEREMKAKADLLARQHEADAKARLEHLTMQLASNELTRQQALEAQQEIRRLMLEQQAREKERDRQARADNLILAASLRAPPQPAPAQIVTNAEGTFERTRDGKWQQVMVDGKPLAGKPPTKDPRALSATAQKELIQTDETITAAQEALKAIGEAKTLNDKAMGGFGSGALATAGSVLPDALRPGKVDATLNLDNIVKGSALSNLRAIFGGNPTEGERKVLLEIQGASSQPAAVRRDIFKRAEAALQARIKVNQDKAVKLRSGEYFGEAGGLSGGSDDVPSAPADIPPPGAVKRK